MPRYFTDEHEWIDVEGESATVGITDYAQEQLGDIVFVAFSLFCKTEKKTLSLGLSSLNLFTKCHSVAELVQMFGRHAG